MPNKGRFGQVLLSGQAVTASPAGLYLNGAQIGGFNSAKPTVVTFNAGPVTWAAMPNAANFFNASFAYVTYMDLSSFTGVNLSVNRTATAGTASGALYLGYLDNPASTAASYISLAPSRIKLNTTNTVATSGFSPIAAGAKSGVYIALLGSSGNAVAGPTFGMITAQFL